MSYFIQVENIKCSGCANTISNKLAQNDHVQGVEVDIEKGQVTIDGDEAAKEEIIALLSHLGYPETGSVEGLQAAASKAKSFVSCAIGRLDNLSK
jgi:copper chaperone